MFGLGTQELLVILVIVLILFGANRLPQLARSLGSSMKEFKKGVNEAQHEETTASATTSNGGNPAAHRLADLPDDVGVGGGIDAVRADLRAVEERGADRAAAFLLGERDVRLRQRRRVDLALQHRRQAIA